MQKISFLAVFLFSGFACGAVTVSYIYSPSCPHCINMKPEWERVVDRFNQTADLNFRIFDVQTQEGQEVASALGNMYVPSVYIDLQRVIEGERSDFYDYLSLRICTAIDNRHPSCSSTGGAPGLSPLVYLIPVAFIGAFIGFAYKQGWIKYAHK